MNIIQAALITGFREKSKVVVVGGENSDPSAEEVQVQVIFRLGYQYAFGRLSFSRKVPLTPGCCLMVRFRATSNFSMATGGLCLAVYGAEAELIMDRMQMRRQRC